VGGAQARGLGLGAAGIGTDPDPVHGAAVDGGALAEAWQLRGAQVADDAVGRGGGRKGAEADRPVAPRRGRREHFAAGRVAAGRRGGRVGCRRRGGRIRQVGGVLVHDRLVQCIARGRLACIDHRQRTVVRRGARNIHPDHAAAGRGAGRHQWQFAGLEVAFGSGRQLQRHVADTALGRRSLDQHRQEDDRQRDQHDRADQALFQGRFHRDSRTAGKARGL
jgi:hypothetical protein